MVRVEREVSRVPEPRVGAAVGHGWGTLKRAFWGLLVVVLIYVGVELLSNVFVAEPVPGEGGGLAGLSVLYSVLVVFPLLVGVAGVFLGAVRGGEVEVGEVLGGFRVYVNAVGGMLLYAVLVVVVVGLVLLIVPGLVALVRLSFVPFLVVDREVSPVEAVRASWDETRGYGWRLLGLFVVNVLILVGGLLVFVVGVFVGLVWAWANVASFYHAVVDDLGRAPGVGGSVGHPS